MDKDELVVNFIISIVTIITSAVLAYYDVPNWGGVTVAAIVMLVVVNCFMKD